MEDHLATLRNGIFLCLAVAAVSGGSELIQPGSGDRDLAAFSLIVSALSALLWLKVWLAQRRRQAAAALLAEARATGKEPDGEHSYTNALLTTLAKTAPTPVALSLGKGVPPLRQFTEDPDHLEWIDSLPFRYHELDGTEVVSLILTLAGYRFYHLSRLDYELKALLVLGEGRTVPCRFHVRRTSRHPATPIVVSRAA